MSLLIYGGTLLTPEVAGRRCSGGLRRPHRPDRPPASGRRALDAGDARCARPLLAPVFIDLSSTVRSAMTSRRPLRPIWQLRRRFPLRVTSFLPDHHHVSAHKDRRRLRSARQGRPAGFRGATPLGLHLEGPFLIPQEGRPQPGILGTPDLSLVTDWSPETHVRLVTLAPELRGRWTWCAALTGVGCVVRRRALRWRPTPEGAGGVCSRDRAKAPTFSRDVAAGAPRTGGCRAVCSLPRPKSWA